MDLLCRSEVWTDEGRTASATPEGAAGSCWLNFLSALEQVTGVGPTSVSFDSLPVRASAVTFMVSVRPLFELAIGRIRNGLKAGRDPLRCAP